MCFGWVGILSIYIGVLLLLRSSKTPRVCYKAGRRWNLCVYSGSHDVRLVCATCPHALVLVIDVFHRVQTIIYILNLLLQACPVLLPVAGFYFSFLCFSTPA